MMTAQHHEPGQNHGRAAPSGPRQSARIDRALAPVRPVRLAVYQHPRNPNDRERRILALLAEGHTHKQAAGHLGMNPRAVTRTLQTMRDRYTTPTNEALIALAIRLQWIAVAIDIQQPTADSP